MPLFPKLQILRDYIHRAEAFFRS